MGKTEAGTCDFEEIWGRDTETADMVSVEKYDNE